RWFVSFHYELEPQPTPKKIDVVGVDLGSRKLAVLSSGEVFESPRALERSLRRLRLWQRRLSRRVKGGKNREKARLRVAKLHYRISCLCSDAIHKLTTAVAKNHETVVVEDLNVQGMLRNRYLARTISDLGLYEIKRQLEYKCRLYGSQLVVADRWFPSSKLCSRCGHVHTKLGSSELFVCPHCGFRCDLNAAINLRNHYYSTAESPAVAACGATSGGGTSDGGLRAMCAMKQEVGTGEPSLDKSNRLALSASSSVDQR
ncbi:MAG: RNA-guided endonuclease TnpB family protein, partial [Gloeomargarita sp. SKYBB_i_bin120]|nr:transposase [Gloeomargarita sp. SKYB120]MDW8178122.1 RNA-guided endonuclease TnpB family protein [Gloeomargarita sp. SKYBB_i_bin120]